MMQKILKFFYALRNKMEAPLFFAVPFLLVIGFFVAHAAPSARVPVGQNNFFVNELPNDVNNNCAYDVFIPLKTQAERASFVGQTCRSIGGHGNICTANRPSCTNFGWAGQFTFSGVGTQQSSFGGIPYLDSISNSFVSAYRHTLDNSSVPNSLGFGGDINSPQQQYSTASISANESYPVEYVCQSYVYDQHGNPYYCNYYSYQVTINGQTYYGCDGVTCIINGQTYWLDIYICGSYICSITLHLPFSGSLLVSGSRSIIISAIVGRINGFNGCCTGTFMCPSGTFLYGLWNDRNVQIRNDWPHNMLAFMYCADSFGATTDIISREIVMFGGGGGVCAQDEYVKGFNSFLVSSDYTLHSQLGTMYCAKLASPSPQAVAEAVNLYTYPSGAISAKTAGNSFRAIVGLTGGWDYGPADSAGPRFYADSFYTRSIPVVY